MKKSDLERIQTSGESSEIKETPTVAMSTSKREGAVLVSPTSLIPVEDSPIFSIPKSEVSVGVEQYSYEPLKYAIKVEAWSSLLLPINELCVILTTSAIP